MRCPFSFEYGGGQRRGKAASHPEVLYQKQKYLKCARQKQKGAADLSK